MSTAETATEVVADVAEEVAEQASSVAEASRGLTGHDVGLLFGGFVIGTGVGFMIGWQICERKLEMKYAQIAADEISTEREHYQAKIRAKENTATKADLEKVISDSGYSAEPPMAVTPPEAVLEAAEEAAETEGPKVTLEVTPEQNVFEQPSPSEEELGEPTAVAHENWNWEVERRRRSPNRPYVIHRDEVHEMDDEYAEVTFTYYDGDDVLCNERDEVIGKEDRDDLIGEANLNRFGHGSGDPTTVYIRNDKLEMHIEVVLSDKSYAEEVQGLHHSESLARRHRRREGRLRDDD